MIPKLKVYSRISGITAFGIGFIVLTGWIFDIPALKSLHPSLVSMKANTAIAIILAGLSLWFFHAPRKSTVITLFVSCCAAFVAAIGLLTLMEYIGGWNFGIDQIFFNEPTGTVGTYIPGRMALNTAICLFSLGIALLLARSKTQIVFAASQFLNLTSILVAITAVIGYFYSMDEFYGFAHFTQMALHTSFALLVIGVGGLCAVPDRGIMVVISGNDFGGFLARRLLPVSIVIPILIGWLRLEGERHEFFGSAFGVLLVAVVYIVLFMFLVWKVAQSLHRFDTERTRSEELLRESEERFDKFMANLPAVVFMKDQESRLLYANPVLKTLFGWHDAVGRLSSELLPPELARQMVVDDQRVLEKGAEVVHEKIIDVNGKEHFFESHKFPFYRKNGEPLLGGISIDETDRKRAEEELRQSQKSYRKLFEDHSAVKLIIDIDTGFILDANHAAAQYYGWTREELKQMKIDQINTLSPEEVKIEIEKVRKNQRVHFEFCHRRADGSVRNVEVFTSKIEMMGKEVLHSIVHDITERKLVEKALRESEDEFRAIFENNSSAIAIIEPDTTISMVNDAYCQISGYSREEVIGMSWTKQIPPDDLERLKEYNRRRLRNPQDAPDKYEFKFYRKNGEIRHALISVSIIQSNQKIITSFTDITERKQAEEALRASEEQFRLLLNSAAEAIYGIDLNGNCTFCNTACLQILGYNHPDELLGKNMHRQIHSKHEDGTPFPIEECRIFRAFKERENSHVEDEVLWKADGTSFPAEYWSYPEIRNGEILGAVVTFLDITERKWAEDLLATQKRRLSDILEGTNVGTWEWDVQTGETRYNDRWAEIIGYSLVELSPISIDTWKKFVHPDDLQRSGDLLEKHFHGELEYYECEARMRHKNGNWVWVLDRGKVASWTKDGKPQVMSGTHQDITERKIAEVERENLIKELQSALDNVKTLQGLIPICANCKKIRDDTGYWQQVEGYIQKHSDVKFSHGICPECAQLLYPNFMKNKQ